MQIVVPLAFGSVLPIPAAGLLAYGIILVNVKLSNHAAKKVLDEMATFVNNGLNGAFSDSIAALMRRQKNMNSTLAETWKVVGPVLMIIGSGLVALVLALGAVAYAAYQDNEVMVSCLLALVALIHVALFLGALVPIAAISDSLNDRTPLGSSLRQLARQMHGWQLDADERTSLLVYMHFVDDMPFGIYLPFLGCVSTSMLASKAGLLLTAAPVIMGAFAGMFKTDA